MNRLLKVVVLSFSGLCLPLMAQEVVVLDSGPHHRVLGKVATYLDPQGGQYTVTNQSYVELAGGMHYWEDAQWKKSREEIEIVNGTALARKGPIKVIFAANLNSLGAIDMESPGGQRFRSHLLGIAYLDAAAGESVLIGEVVNTMGTLSPPNQIYYRDAFAGDVIGDVRYTYTRHGLEQDVILLAAPPPPQSWGMNPDTTRLEVWTEFVQAPQPIITETVLASQQDLVLRQGMFEPDLIDQTLNFGDMVIAEGFTFLLQAKDRFDNLLIPTGKSWETVEGRVVLIEKVDYSSLQPFLNTLPQLAKGKPPPADQVKGGENQLLAKRGLPGTPRDDPRDWQQNQIARVDSPSQGVVIDYSTVNPWLTNYVFQGDTTYFVSGKTYLYGTTVLEGGAVIKYDTNNNWLSLRGPLDCRTYPHHPAILTARDDDTVGEILDVSLGTPTQPKYGNIALYFSDTSQNFYLHDIRVRYIYRSLALNMNNAVELRHAQLGHGNQAVYGLGGANLTHRNVLFHDFTNYVFFAPHTNVGEHATFHGINNLAYSSSYPALLTNSLLVSVTNNVYWNGAAVEESLSDSGVFATVGAGAHYLADNQYRDQGTTNINAKLLEALKRFTTEAPWLLTNGISQNTNLGPVVARDTNALDLGYHYPPVDYAISEVDVTNAVVVLTNGVVLATYGGNGLNLWDHSTLISEGTPLYPNRLVRYYAVQELATNWGNGNLTTALTINPTNNSVLPPLLKMRFTKSYVPSKGGFHTYAYGPTKSSYSGFELKDSEILGGDLFIYETNNVVYGLTNNLLERINFDFWGESKFHMFNNLLQGLPGDLLLKSGGTNTWEFKDNLLDNCALINYSANLDRKNNFYHQSTNFHLYFAQDATETNLASLPYEWGSLGPYYHSVTSLLVNAGSRWATNAGLFHFTITTNETKEAASKVDVGYHYVALDAGGFPVDSDNDGQADYVEDYNGNGSKDTGETSFHDPILLLRDSLNYIKGNPPTLLDTNAVVVDDYSPDFDAGQLTASILSGVSTDDLLGIRHQGTNTAQIGVSGSNVTYGGTDIGTFSGGSGTNALIVSFNTNATVAAVQALVQNLAFTITTNNPSTDNRSLELVLTDGDGGISMPAVQTVTVNCAQALDVMLLMDVSNSLDNDDFLEAKLAASNFVNHLELEVDEVGLISFAGFANLQSVLTNDGPAVQEMILGLTKTNGTRFHPAFDLGRSNMTQTASNVLPVMLLLSDGRVGDEDGNPTEEEIETNTELARTSAQAVKDAGIRLITIGYGNNEDGTNLMKEFASSAHDAYYAPSAEEIATNFNDVATFLCRPPNVRPTVSITNPTNQQLFLLSSTNIVLSATANDSDGSVTKVEFFNGTTKLGEVLSQPYDFTWEAVTYGSYTLSAKATDDSEALTTSADVAITVNALPTVIIVTPTNHTEFTETVNVTISASASDLDGTINQVDFYHTNTLIGTVTEETGGLYTMEWNGRTVGIYPIVAKATDNRSSSALSPIGLFKVHSTNSLPWIEITSPNDTDSFRAGSDITITATATNTEAGISITNVEFYVNGALLGSDFERPFALSRLCWQPGNYELTARAYDDYGFKTNSEVVTITVDQVEPIASEGYWDLSIAFQGSVKGVLPAVEVDQEGFVYVGGCDPDFATGLGPIAKWDGSAWSSLYLSDSGAVFCIKETGNHLLVGGNFTSGGPNSDLNYIAQLSGTNWSRIGSELNDAVHAIAYHSAETYIGGSFTNAGSDLTVRHIARLEGTNWVSVGNGLTVTSGTAVRAIAGVGQTIYVGGDFTAAGGDTNIQYIARLEGTNWVSVGSGVNGPVRALEVCGDRLFAGGDFTTAGGITNANCIAQWSDGVWSPVGSGVDGFDTNAPPSGECGSYPGDAPSVCAIVSRGDDLYVGGEFSTLANGTNLLSVNHIARASFNRFNEQWTWTSLETGVKAINEVLDDFVLGLAIRENPSTNAYELFISGEFDLAGNAPSENIAQWVVGMTNSPIENAPTVEITSPANETVFTIPTGPISITATAEGQPIKSVEFFVDGTSIGVDISTNSFTMDWSDSTKGLHQLTALAKDGNDPVRSAISEPVFIKVSSSNSPSANFDQVSLAINSPSTLLDVLANDSMVGSNALHITQVLPVDVSAGMMSMGYGATNLIYTPHSQAYGTDYFKYTITDTQGSNDTALVMVTVEAPPAVFLFTPLDGLTTNVSETLNISGGTYGYNAAVANVEIFINGIKFQETTNASFDFDWTTNEANFYTIAAVATDSLGLSNTSDPITVALVDTNSSPPTAIISNLVNTVQQFNNLSNHAVIRDGLFSLEGQARDPDPGDPVAYQVMLFAPGDSNDALANITPPPLNGQGFHSGTDTNGDLGILDFTLMTNGVYDLELTVHGGGDVATDTVRISLESGLKIGHFSFSEEDLVIPVNGIPLTVVRTYNSINRNQGDFGVSWTYAINDMNVVMDEERQWVTATTSSLGDPLDSSPSIFSLRTGGNRNVTLTLPDGRRTTFAFSPREGIYKAYAEWSAAPGVHDTLEVTGSAIINYFSWPPLQWQDGGSHSTYESYDIPGLVLTTVEGTQYTLTRNSDDPLSYWYEQTPGDFIEVTPRPDQPKLSSILQPSGDQIFITENEITHYNPTGAATRTVFFERDQANRITAIHDPVGGTNGLAVVEYVYHQQTGNLVEVRKLTDRPSGEYVTNIYHYDHPDFPHYITAIDDAIGNPITRNDYDEEGRLVRHTDAEGKTIEYVHNLEHRLEIITDRLTNSTAYHYDTRGNVTAITNALNEVTSFSYDDDNNRTSETNPLNQTTQYAYAGNGLLSATTNALGDVNAFSYASQHARLLTAVDALGHGLTNSYDDRGLLTNVIDALGHQTHYHYDANSLLVSISNAMGVVTENQYDQYGNLTNSLILEGGLTNSSTGYAYDPNGNQTNQTLWWGANAPLVTAFVYDAQNRLVTTVDPLGNETTHVYDELGRLESTTDKLGRLTTRDYDAKGNLWRTTFPDQTTESAAYDAEGRRAAHTNRLGFVTQYGYDPMGRLTRTILPDLAENLTAYDPGGRIQYTVDFRGATNFYGHDAVGRRISITNALGFETRYQFDAAGNMTNMVDALNRPTDHQYDVLNRRVKTVYPATELEGARPFRAMGYDKLGRLVAITNEAGTITRRSYDGAGLLVGVTNAWGTTEATWVTYQYDPAGNQTNQTDALGRITSHTYDPLGRRALRKLPGGQSEHYLYDPVGNLVGHTNFNGLVLTNTYDSMNRLLARADANGILVSFTYSASGKRVQMVDGSGTHAYVYDNRDRLRTNETPVATLYYDYDANGNLTNLYSSTSSGVSLAYRYDSLNRLINVLDNGISGSADTASTFDEAGNLAGLSYPNGVTNLWQYNSRNQLTNAVWKLNGSLLASFFYQLDSLGNRTGLSDTVNALSRSYSWQHDALLRLTNQTMGGAAPTGTLVYQYDGVGNRTNRSGTLGPLGSTNHTYTVNDWLGVDTYDSQGNTRTNAVGTDYRYDDANRLTNANGGNVMIVYDGDGNRVLKDVGGAITLYLVDSQNPSGYPQVLEEFTVSGGATNLSRIYSYGLDLISQRQEPGATVHYFGYDGLGSVRFLADSSGNLTDDYLYDAFGTQISTNGTTPNNYKFAGEQFDPDLGLYYLRARYLNSDIGRFWTMDTFEGNRSDPMSLHKYLYAHANPVNNLDPSGQFSLTSLNTTISTGLRITAQVGVRAGRTLTKARQFFWNSRRFQAISRAYWKANGPANGRSLHHWLIPQRWSRIPQGLRNAGFNLLELPKVLPGNLGLNQWMGFAARWGGYRAVFAYTIENGIRILIPLAIYEAATIGSDGDQNSGEPVVEQFELKPSDWDDDRGFEDLRELTAGEEEPVLGPGQLDQLQP